MKTPKNYGVSVEFSTFDFGCAFFSFDYSPLSTNSVFSSLLINLQLLYFMSDLLLQLTNKR